MVSSGNVPCVYQERLERKLVKPNIPQFVSGSTEVIGGRVSLCRLLLQGKWSCEPGRQFKRN